MKNLYTELSYIGIGSKITINWSNGRIMEDEIKLDRESPNPIRIFRKSINCPYDKSVNEYCMSSLDDLKQFYTNNSIDDNTPMFISSIEVK